MLQVLQNIPFKHFQGTLRMAVDPCGKQFLTKIKCWIIFFKIVHEEQIIDFKNHFINDNKGYESLTINRREFLWPFCFLETENC